MYFVIAYIALDIYSKYENEFSWKLLLMAFVMNLTSRTISFLVTYLVYRIISYCKSKLKKVCKKEIFLAWMSGFTSTPIPYILLNESFKSIAENEPKEEKTLSKGVIFYLQAFTKYYYLLCYGLSNAYGLYFLNNY